MSAIESHALWRFAVDVYARDGVSAQCLALQDEHGLEVDVILACLWCATRDPTPLSPERIASARARTAEVRRWVGELRGVRRAVKSEADRDDAARLYAVLKATELQAENVLLGRLADVLAPRDEAVADPVAVAQASLSAYATLRDRPAAVPLLHALAATPARAPAAAPG